MQFDKIVSKLQDRFMDLVKSCTVDLSFVFADANNVKQEADEHEEQADKETGDTEKDKSAAFFKQLDGEIQDMNSERGFRMLERQAYVTCCCKLVQLLKTKKWTKSSTNAFVKQVFFNKDNVFNQTQVEELEKVMNSLAGEDHTSMSKTG